MTTPPAGGELPGKRPISFLAGPYGHPVHPVLVSIPIGSFVAALIFDLAARAAADPEPYARGAALLLIIGLAGVVLAAAFGLLDLQAIPRRTRAFRVGIFHMSANVAAAILFAVSLAMRIDDLTTTPTTAALAVLLVALGVMGLAGFLGGMLSYHYGVRVADEETQAHGFVGAPIRSRPIPPEVAGPAARQYPGGGARPA
jgi:uncharacterized membrane protein